MGLGLLIWKNVWRHPIRSLLTALGIAVALLAFFMIRTFINAWHAGVDASVSDRLITRNQMSLIFLLPKSYQLRIQNVPGIAAVTSGTWYGGIYKDENYHFAQFAVDSNYLDIYTEFIVDDAGKTSFMTDRRGALLGRDAAEKLGLKVGDSMTLKGVIYPGDMEFIIRGIFYPKDGVKDTRFMLFHYEYLNERTRAASFGPSPDYVGYFAMRLEKGANPSGISSLVDGLFTNSYAETLTQTETAFVQGFVSMSSALLLAMDAVSLVVIPIILLVLMNTMLMAARERYREYSILRAIGFGNVHIAVISIGEALFISGLGFVLLCILVIPVFRISANFVLGELASFFPRFPFDRIILAESLAIALSVGLFAGVIPYLQLRKLKVSSGLRG